MVLVLPSGEPVADSCESIVVEVLGSPAVQQANAAFLARSGEAPVPASCRSACALMGEEALVDFSSGEWHLGSTDATTCLIAVVVCPTTRMAWAAHYNSRLAAHDTSIRRLLPRHMRAPEVYLVGSFREASGESAATLGRVLRLLHAAPLPFLVRLACVDAANTDAAGAPRALHLAVRCAAGGDSGGGDGAGGSGCAAVASPSGFADRGPELPRRFAHDHLADSSCSEGEGGDGDQKGIGGSSDDDGSGDEATACNSGGGEGGAGSSRKKRRRDAGWGSSLRSIVDTATGRLRIPGLRCRRPHPYLLAHYAQQLQLPDASFLQRNSTSPEHEPPNFVGDIRAAYEYILARYAEGVTCIQDAWFEWARALAGREAIERTEAAGGSLGSDRVQGPLLPGSDAGFWRALVGSGSDPKRPEIIAL